jgi:malonyl-CoA/methylmalonyl-CoA synthetase
LETMTNANLFSLIQSRFPDDMSQAFLTDPDGGSISYGDLDRQSSQMADALRHLGTNSGDRVVVQVEKSAEAVLLYLACLRAGAIYVPLNTAYTAAELDYFVGDANPHVLVCRPETLDSLRAIATSHGVAHTLSLGTNADGTLMDAVATTADGDGAVAVRSDDDTAAILYTSGTTGRSKGAMLSHGNLSSNARCLHELWGFVPGDVLLHALPIYHVHGLFVALHCALLNASTVWFLPRFDVDQIMSLMPRSTVMMGVPTFYVRLLDHDDFGAEVCKGMRLFIAGSAPLLSETFETFEERTGHRILERYGMTEAGMITSNPYDGERLAGTVGFALPGTAARVCDSDGIEVPRGEPGTLEISGPNVFKGYWQNPEKTAAEFRSDGCFITGDVATMWDDGRIAIVGRAKDLIISGGFNVYPKEIELEIDAMDGVIESAVIGLAHRDFGEAVTAVVVREPGHTVAEADIKVTLGERLAKFKQPKQVFFVDALPRNAMGKVQKNALRERFADTYNDDQVTQRLS